MSIRTKAVSMEMERKARLTGDLAAWLLLRKLAIRR